MDSGDPCILVLEDNDSDYHLARAALRRSMPGAKIERVERLQELQHADFSRFDLIVSDLGLPDSSGMDTVRAIRAAAPETALVVMTGNDEESMALEALKYGAQDYFFKQHIDPAMLGRSVRYALERHALTTQLAETYAQLNQTNEDMQQFTRAVVHDLKSPLISINGFADVAREGFEKGDAELVERGLTVIKETCTAANAMVHSLEELARVGRKALEPKAVDLGAIVADLQDRLRLQVEERSARITVDGPLPQVHGDAQLLGRLLENLIGNALRYGCPEPGGTITIGAETRPGNMLIFVEDNGPGIDPRDHERAFQVFQRLNSREDGSGLGLTICKRIIQEHHGSIWVESAPGDGARFCFTVPHVPQAHCAEKYRACG